MVKGAEKDIYDPNYVLKKNTSIKARKVIYFIIISFFIYAVGFHIILDIPRLVNRDFAIFTGRIENIEEIEENKYDIIIENDGESMSFDSVYAENLCEGSYIEIDCPQNPLYMDIVAKNNDNVTDIYQKYYGSNLLEKICICIYGLVNFAVQFLQLKKVPNNGMKSKNSIYCIWKITLYLFTLVFMISLINIVNNLYIGLLAAVLFAVYNLCYLIFSISDYGGSGEVDY